MREYSKIHPQIWIGHTGRQIRQFGVETQLLSHYLISSPHATMIGIYYLPIAIITHETGISHEAVLKGFRNLSDIDFCTYETEMEYVWVHNMALYQISKRLHPRDNRVVYVNTQYHSLPKLECLSRFYDKYKEILCIKDSENNQSTQDASKPLSSQEQEHDHEQDKRFMSGKPDVSPSKNIKYFKKRSADTAYPFYAEATEVLNFLNEKTGKNFRHVDTNLKLIAARLQSGASVQHCRQIIAMQVRDWESSKKMYKCLRPMTLFDRDNFEQYIGELVLPKEEVKRESN